MPGVSEGGGGRSCHLLLSAAAPPLLRLQAEGEAVPAVQREILRASAQTQVCREDGQGTPGTKGRTRCSVGTISLE